MQINEFPLSVGFGKLNSAPVDKDGLISADYFFRGRAVHRIIHDTTTGKWQLKDIFDNAGRHTTAKRLETAVLLHFNSLDCTTSTIFRFFSEVVSGMGNIYVQDLLSLNDEGGLASYFPAGRLVILRLPVFFDATGRANANILMNEIPFLEKEKRPLVKLLELYNSSVIQSRTTGQAEVIPVLMFEYIVSLAAVPDVVEWFIRRNLISTERIFRLIIQDSKLKNEHTIQSFPGSGNDGPYSLLFKGLDESKTSFEELHNRFIEGFHS